MTYSIFYSSRHLESFLWLSLAAALGLLCLSPRTGARIGRSTAFLINSLARRTWLAAGIAAALPMVVRLVLLPVFPFPQAAVHDEFSNLLAGDTLAHGRVANPTPLYWQHFETEYELLQPTYASQYQPGQGLALAAGQIIAGHPWWGVWFSTGVLFAVLVWALVAIMPARWALFGSVIAALQFGIFGFWMNSYFGGSVPAIAGALVFGSLARQPMRRPQATAIGPRKSVQLAIICGVGLCLLFATRPAEGLIWLVAAIFCYGPLAKREARRERLALVSLTLIVIAGLSSLAIYNQRVTGHAAVPPYLLYRHLYGTPQSYWWQPAVMVSHFDYPELEANYRDQLRYWRRRYSASALWDASWRRLRDFWRFFIGPLLTPAALAFIVSRKRVRLRFWLWVSLAFVLDHATYHAWYPQQSASETVLIVLFVVEGWRHLEVWRRERRVGLALSGTLSACLLITVLMLGMGLWVRTFSARFSKSTEQILSALVPGPRVRDRVVRSLEKRPGKHLVFVHYGPRHPWYDEWVFNGADLQSAQIIFSRMWTPGSDLALARSMPDRDIWLADPDGPVPLVRIGPDDLLAFWQTETKYDARRWTVLEKQYEQN